MKSQHASTKPWQVIISLAGAGGCVYLIGELFN